MRGSGGRLFWILGLWEQRGRDAENTAGWQHQKGDEIDLMGGGWLWGVRAVGAIDIVAVSVVSGARLVMPGSDKPEKSVDQEVALGRVPG